MKISRSMNLPRRICGKREKIYHGKTVGPKKRRPTVQKRIGDSCFLLASLSDTLSTKYSSCFAPFVRFTSPINMARFKPSTGASIAVNVLLFLLVAVVGIVMSFSPRTASTLLTVYGPFLQTTNPIPRSKISSFFRNLQY